MAVQKTRRKLKFGEKMAELREATPEKLKPIDVANLLQISRTTVERCEGGLSLPRWPSVFAMLTVYRATSEQIVEVRALWDRAAQGSTTVENAANLPPKYRAFRHDESDAVSERCLCVGAITGLLQTAGYADAQQEVAQRFIEGENQQQRLAEERRSRQQLLEGDDPLQLHVILGQALLLQVVGGKEVMAEQLRHLLNMGGRPNVTLQVVPLSEGAWVTSPSVILGFDGDDPDIAYLEHAAGGETVENVEDVRKLNGTFEDVAENKAAPEGVSASFIQAALDALKDT